MLLLSSATQETTNDWFRIAWGPGSYSLGKLQVGQIGTQQKPLRLCGADGAWASEWFGLMMLYVHEGVWCVMRDVVARRGPRLGSYVQCWRLGIWQWSDKEANTLLCESVWRAGYLLRRCLAGATKHTPEPRSIVMMQRPVCDKKKGVSQNHSRRHARKCLEDQRDEERSLENLRGTVRGVGWDVPASNDNIHLMIFPQERGLSPMKWKV